jgi:[acyl-carrier-protein] S-malonyltransferase
LIFACPGQGSQSKGFLTPWLETYPKLENRLNQYSDSVGMDLVLLGTQSEEEEIRNTAVAQRLIVGASLAVYREVFSEKQLTGVLGHSVGEIAAAAISGVISDQDAMRLVAIRADSMAEAAALTPTSMAAVLGGEEDVVLGLLASLELEPANFNGAGQIVAAGSKESIVKLLASPPEKSRVIELKVAGAFHTSYMQSAVEKVRSFAVELQVSDPSMDLWSNSQGQVVRSGEEVLRLLIDQISRPVRWDKCMQSINKEDSVVVELPPAGALAGLLKRGADKVLCVALKTPADVSKVS